MRKIFISDHKVVHDFSFRLFASRWFSSWLPLVWILDLLDNAIGCPWLIALSRSCHSHDIRTCCGFSTTGWPSTTCWTAPTTIWLSSDWCCI